MLQETLTCLRGPAALAMITFSVVMPYLATMSWFSLVRVTLFVLAFFLAAVDVIHLIRQRTRRFVQKSLGQIVLDDVLCAIFHPQEGVLAVLTCMFFGNAALYSFPTTEEQRVQLVQHALDGTGLLDEDTSITHHAKNYDETPAHKILMEPGGFLRLAPPALQQWCFNEEQMDTARQLENSRIATGAKDMDEEKSTESEISCSLETPVKSPPISEQRKKAQSGTGETVGANWSPPPNRGRRNHGSIPASRPIPRQISHRPLPPLHEIVSSILQDWSIDNVQRLFHAIPDGSIEVVGGASIAFLAIQFRYSKRARSLLWNCLQASATIGGTTTLITAILALVTKRHFSVSQQQQRTGPTSSERSLISSVGKLLHTLVSKIGAEEVWRRLKGILAAFVMYYFGRRRTSD